MERFVVFPRAAYRVVIQLCMLVLVERASFSWAWTPRVSVPSRRVVRVVRLLWAQEVAL